LKHGPYGIGTNIQAELLANYQMVLSIDLTIKNDFKELIE
jgi:hypothetical protein